MSGLCAGPGCDAAVRVVRGRARQGLVGCQGLLVAEQGLAKQQPDLRCGRGKWPFRPPMLLRCCCAAAATATELVFWPDSKARIQKKNTNL